MNDLSTHTPQPRRTPRLRQRLLGALLLALSSVSQAVVFPFVDDMEGGANFTATGRWALSSEQVHGGAKAWSDSPGGAYSNNSDSALTLASPLDLTSATSPQLLFWHQLESEAEFDYARVEYSTNGGGSWSGLSQYTGIHSWRREQVDLSALAGQGSVLLRFRLTSDKSVVADGWHIDDLVVAEPLNPVTSLSVTSVGRDNVVLGWTANQDAAFDLYAIYRARSAGVTTADSLVAEIDNAATIGLTDSGLFAATTYYYRIYTVDANGLHTPGKEVQTSTIAGGNFPLDDDVESSTDHWVVSGAWATTAVTYNGVTTTAWTDSPSGSYPAGSDTNLMINLDLGSALMPVLTFDQKYSFETDSDFGYIEVREEGSSSWQRIYGVTGAAAAWVTERLDLTNYAGKKVDLRFRLVSDSNGTQSDGWYLDNFNLDDSQVAPLAYPFSEDFEAGSGAWQTSSWAIAADAHAGTYGITDSPAGNYTPLTEASLTLASTLDLTGALKPILTYWERFDIRNCPYGSNTGGCAYYDSDYDYARIYVSSYYGHPGTWQQVASVNGSSDWRYRQVDLSAWAGLPNVRVKFVMLDTGPSNGTINYTYPGWTLDQVRIEEAPHDVVLSVAASSSHQVDLAWATANSDSDFARYEVYRSTSPGVSRTSTLVTEMGNQAAVGYSDAVALNQPTIYYYRVWVVDQAGNVSPGSNEVEVSYSVPLNNLSLDGGVLTFSEDAEGGTAQWAWGSPWGLSTVNPHGGSQVWTDSPGANYAANADTSLVTYLNLNGTSNPVLTFWHRYSLEFGKDFVYLEVSEDQGASWSALRSFTGTESLWNMERVDLGGYAGHASLGVRFRLVADGVNQQDGYYLDDLSVRDQSLLAAYPFFDDMEGSQDRWIWSSTWGIAVPDAGTGDHAFADSPEGAYQAGHDGWLKLAIDLSSATLPVLTFRQKYALEVDSDFGFVEVQESGSSSWTRLMAVTGAQVTWGAVALDLTEYAGRQVALRFRLLSDSNGTQSDGWYIDDVRIDESSATPLPFPFTEGFEGSLADHWHTGGWQPSADAFSGGWALTDSEEGDYAPYTQAALVMASTIDLSATAHPMLSFRHKYELRSCPYGSNTGGCAYYDSDYDYAKVYVSSFNGQSGTWQQLASFNGTSDWRYTQLDLSPWKGLPKVRIKFVVEDSGPSNGSINYTQGGWSLDQITIEENPVDVALALVGSNQHEVQLSWNGSSDPDFLRYEVRRAAATGVTTAATLVASISDPATTSYTDPVALVQPGTYYYRLWVIDQDGNVSLGSNEVVASYADSIPLNTGLGFSENGESGSSAWSWGVPWGLTDANPHGGSYAWTDSPGSNYAANANTSLVTLLDLTGSIHPVLSYWQRYSLEQGMDFVYLEVSSDNGASWTQLRATTGTETTWNRERVDLTAYAGNARVGLRFRLVSDAQNQADGFHLDDLTIQEESVAAGYPFSDSNDTTIVPWLYDSPWGRTSSEYHSGGYSWTDSPYGAYAAGSDTSLYLTVDLSSAVMPVLDYWQRYAFDPNSDFGYIEVRELGASSWTRIYFVTGSAATWGRERLDLANYAGKQVQLRFRVVADTNGIQSDGWYIDDLTIAETQVASIPYPLEDGLEAGSERWFTGSWSLTPDPQSGSYALTDSVEGDYGAYTYSALTLASTIDLAGAVHPLLSFWHKYETRACPYASNTGGCGYYDSDYDYAKVYLSTYNGQPGTWVQIASFNGSQSSYAYHEIDLSAWRGLSNVRIKFVMEDSGPNNGSTNYRYPGWSIDTLRIGEDTNVPTTLIAASGNGQDGITGQPLSQPLVALVRDSGGTPTAGIQVDFTITGGNGSVNPTSAVSDANGLVSTLFTLGSTAGPNAVSAQIATSSESAVFNATGYAAAQPVYLLKVSGGGQVGAINTTLNNPLAVQVTDVGGNPSAGVSVTYSVIGGDALLDDGAGGATTLARNTDTNGMLSINLLLGATPGTSTVSVSSTGLQGSPMSFTANTVLPGGSLGDTDGDGIPDDWESAKGLNPLSALDASADPDGDTLTNLQEYLAHSNPQSADSDGDTLPDAWEVRYGLNPNSASDALLDSDGDGVSNAQEYLDGTVPTRLDHFSLTTSSNSWMDLYGSVTIDGLPAQAGDEVAVYDADGTLCGHYVVQASGSYGFVHVYADDPATSADEGAELGDTLSFRLWDVSAQVEISAAPSSVVSWSGDQQRVSVNLAGASAYGIPLRAGWNLISFPVKTTYYVGSQPSAPMLPGTSYQPVTSLAQVFASLAGKLEYVRAFDDQGAKSYDPALPEFSDLSYIAGGYGYWLKLSAAGQLVVSGVRAQPEESLALHTGWNLVGYWHPALQYTGTLPLVDLPAEVTQATQVSTIHQIVQALGSDYRQIRSFDANGAHTYDPALGSFNDLDYLAPGYGLWIDMGAAASLHY